MSDWSRKARFSACGRKRPFRTKKKAQRHASGKPGRAAVYKCIWCFQWHVFTPEPKK